jgi:hypothetical protein
MLANSVRDRQESGGGGIYSMNTVYVECTEQHHVCTQLYRVLLNYIESSSNSVSEIKFSALNVVMNG